MLDIHVCVCRLHALLFYFIFLFEIVERMPNVIHCLPFQKFSCELRRIFMESTAHERYICLVRWMLNVINADDCCVLLFYLYILELRRFICLRMQKC